MQEYGPGTVVSGRGFTPWAGSGVACKINSLDDAHVVTDQHVLLFGRTVRPTSQHGPVLLSLTLRVRGIVVQQGDFFMHHIGQIARECGVPIVDISPADMARIPNGANGIAATAR